MVETKVIENLTINVKKKVMWLGSTRFEVISNHKTTTLCVVVSLVLSLLAILLVIYSMIPCS